jgi:hypothetical protein
MNAEPLLPLQAALVAKLKGTPAIAALVGGRVFDRFPLKPDYPAIAVGTADQSVAVEEAEDCTEGSENFIQVQVFSRDEALPGMQTVKQIAGEIRFALRDWRPAVAGHRIDGTEYRTVDYFRDDGLTSRAVMTFAVMSQADD